MFKQTNSSSQIRIQIQIQTRTGRTGMRCVLYRTRTMLRTGCLTQAGMGGLLNVINTVRCPVFHAPTISAATRVRFGKAAPESSIIRQRPDHNSNAGSVVPSSILARTSPSVRNDTTPATVTVNKDGSAMHNSRGNGTDTSTNHHMRRDGLRELLRLVRITRTVITDTNQSSMSICGLTASISSLRNFVS